METSFTVICPKQGGAQISLAEVCRSGEKSTRWYNLLSYKYLKKQCREPQPAEAPGPDHVVSALSELIGVVFSSPTPAASDLLGPSLLCLPCWEEGSPG